jgi:hypothetical protein
MSKPVLKVKNPLLARAHISMIQALLLGAALVTAGCQSDARPPVKPVKAVWRSVGSWSGKGSTQTESFELSGLWRIRWQARNEASPAAGTLHVTVNSAVSGRPLMTAVDHKGVGSDAVYVTEDPHLFYLVIDSSNIDWWIAAEEPVASQQTPK